MEQGGNDVPAHPLLGFQLLENPEQPELAMIAFESDAGPSLFIVNKEKLDELSAAFNKLAQKMPPDRGGGAVKK